MTYDVIVIGSGQGGNPLAYRLSQDGLRVAIVESNKLGGTCINTGCTPTKTLVASAQVAHYVRDSARWGVHTDPPTVNLAEVQARKEDVVAKSRSGWEKKFDGSANPRLYRTRARFVGPKQVEVSGEVLTADKIFIDTGGRPSVPTLEGIDSVPFLTNVSILGLNEIPKHLLVLGGGYIGLEFAQMFRRFGSEVTVVHTGAQLLPQEDQDIATELLRALSEEGLQILLNAQAKRVRSAGGIELDVDTAEGPKTLSGSHLLVATGRKPNVEDLNLESTGVKLNERGFIAVNDRLETSAEGIWAIGDVTGGPAFTHISYNDYQILYANVFQGGTISTKSRLVPYAVYTDPELGRVGLTEKAARAQGRKLKIGTIPLTWVARAIERGETSGLMKLVVDAQTDKVIGAAMLCSEGGELVQIISTLMLCDKPYTTLKGAIYIHPTLAEGFFTLMEAVKPVD